MSNQRPQEPGKRAYVLLRVQGRSDTRIAEHDTQAEPVVVQGGVRRNRSAPLAVEQLAHIERGLALSHVIDGTPELLTHEGQGCARPGFFSSVVRDFWPAGWARRKSTAASEKAHVRWVLPIFVPEVP
jgi:hypothetical protein